MASASPGKILMNVILTLLLVGVVILAVYLIFFHNSNTKQNVDIVNQNMNIVASSEYSNFYDKISTVGNDSVTKYASTSDTKFMEIRQQYFIQWDITQSLINETSFGGEDKALFSALSSSYSKYVTCLNNSNSAINVLSRDYN